MQFKGKTLPILVGLAALLVEACAALFSVYGLSKLFSGASLAVIFMAGSLEVAKIITASFLYRKWKTINLLMKIYLTAGVIVLIGITSMGIYGFLSNAFQGATVGLETEASKIVMYEERLENLKADKKILVEEKQDLLSNMDRDLDALNFADSTNYLLINTRKRQVRNVYLPEIQKRDAEITTINTKVDSITGLLSDLRVKTISTGAEVGPIIFVAQAFDVEIGTVVKYLIFVFIGVFDPLAVVLVIATNKAWMDLHAPKVEKSVPVTTRLKPTKRVEPTASQHTIVVHLNKTTPEPSSTPPPPPVPEPVKPVPEKVTPTGMPPTLDAGGMPRTIG